MPYTVTLVATKPQGVAWWNYPLGSANDQAKIQLFDWIAQQPGYLRVELIPTSENVSTNIFTFETEELYQAMATNLVLQPAAITRSEYNSANGITWTSSAVTT